MSRSLTDITAYYAAIAFTTLGFLGHQWAWVALFFCALHLIATSVMDIQSEGKAWLRRVVPVAVAILLFRQLH